MLDQAATKQCYDELVHMFLGKPKEFPERFRNRFDIITAAAILAEGGRDGDALEDVNEYFDKSIIKDQFELAMRMAEVARSTSEWHRRMTSENLSQSGQLVNLKDMPVGTEAYIYKPPTQQESIRRGRKVKHIDHYIGPGHILKHIGTRSVKLRERAPYSEPGVVSPLVRKLSL